MKVADHSLIILIVVVFGGFRNVVAYSDAAQPVTVSSICLSASDAHANENFFFNLHTNLTMREWIDQSGNQRPGIVDGPSLKTVYNTMGLEFDGVDDVLSVPNSRSLNPENELTVEMWVQFASYGSDAHGRDWFTLLSKGSYWGTSSYSLLFAANSSDRVVLFLLNGTRVSSARTFAKNNVWYHTAATFDGSFASIFLNGELAASMPFHNNITRNDDDLYIGREKKGQYPLNGLIGALRIYDRALSKDDISLLYQGTVLNISGSLVLDLSLKNLTFSFERSEDGLDFIEIFQSNIGLAFFPWKEKQPGKYFYRIGMPSVESDTMIVRYSNICVVNISQPPMDSEVSIVLLYACLLVLTLAVGLYYSWNGKGKRFERNTA